MKFVRQLRGSPFAFPLVALVALVLLIISETAYYQANKSLDQLGPMSTVRLNNVEVAGAMTEAETAQRGYLLTGRDDYIGSYRAATARVRNLLDQLSEHYRRDPQELAMLADLESNVQRKLSEMETTIGLHASGRGDAALQLMLNDIGKSQMEDIRAASARLIAHESERIAAERRKIHDTLSLGRIGVGTMTALSVLAVLLYLRQTAALVRQQREQRHAVQVERDQFEQQVRERTAELTELARHLQTAREDERSRLARDLHDELGALLTAAKLDAARLKSRLPDMSDEAAERLAHLNESLNSGIALKRRIIEDLRPSSLSNLGLVAALQILAREFGDRSGLAVELDVEPVPLSATSELTVYRLVQEALTNIVKHAQASRVTIGLHATAEGVQVSIGDDGSGFDPHAERRSTHGLLGMHYRVEAEGGAMRLQSAPGGGTLISAVLPPKPQAEDEPGSTRDVENGPRHLNLAAAPR